MQTFVEEKGLFIERTIFEARVAIARVRIY